MKLLKKITSYFTIVEILIWIISVTLIISSFFIFDRSNYLTLITSLLGVTSLIFNAKGNPTGQILIIIFSIIYGIISFSNAYYGEMLTYVGMSLPMSVLSFISWIKNPYKGNKNEVKVNSLNKLDMIILPISAIIITIIFYFILEYFNTANLLVSTISVTTSYVAVYLTFRRSPYFALGYAFNDIVLIILWGVASFENKTFISMVVCFIAFLINDIYTFINWKKMKKKQSNNNQDEVIINE